MINVFVVDDSAFIRKVFSRIFASNPGISVVGSAETGLEALRKIAEQRPDVVTLDVDLPGMSGLALLRKLRALYPTLPVIMLSTHTKADSPTTREALSLGAVDFIDKSRVNLMNLPELLRDLSARIHACVPALRDTTSASLQVDLSRCVPWSEYELVVIGASTGGPAAIQSLLERTPSTFPVPIAIVQHMPPGFTRAFAERLNSICAIHVVEATHGARLTPGTATIAPGGSQLVLDADLTVMLYAALDGEAHAPSVNALMKSAAVVRPGRVVGILLTGMGEDGADGMVELQRSGSMTIAQSADSCAVYGMPRIAHERSGVRSLLSLTEIGALFSGPGVLTDNQADQGSTRLAAGIE